MLDEQQLLEQAIHAIRAKDRGLARELLDQLIKHNPQNDQAWMYLAFAIEDRQAALACLRRAIELNPHNAKAHQLIQRLEGEVQPVTASNVAPDTAGKGKKRSALRLLAIPLLVGIICIILWVLVRPGVFVVQPIGMLPEGATVIYHSRNPAMPFFSSPDSLCLQIQGSVSLLCRGIALGSAIEITDRVILRLPYNHWAYLQSTGGLEFEL